MTLVIAVWLGKGGCGKTTISVGTAEAAAYSTPTVLIDSDPQGSSSRWAELAAAAGQPFRSKVHAIPAADLPSRIHGLRNQAGLIVIDSPPPGPGAERIADAAITAADFVIVPTSTAPADLDRVPAAYALIQRHSKPARAVLNQVRAGLMDQLVAREALAAWGVPIFATAVPLTVAIQRAYGQPVKGPLLAAGISLMTELLKEIQP